MPSYRYSQYYFTRPQGLVVAVAQQAYRFYVDGTESGSTALAAQNASPTVDLGSGDVNLQLRTLLQSTTGKDLFASDDFQLQYEKNASGTWVNVSTAVAGTLFDSNPATSYDTLFTMSGTGVTDGQTFLGNGQRLARVGFYMTKVGTPTGTWVAVLYGHTGTFGVNGKGMEPLLATSTTVRVPSDVSGSMAWSYFDFDASYTLTNGVPYFIGLVQPTGTSNSTNCLKFGFDFDGATHAGNMSERDTGGLWSQTSFDAVFEVYSNVSGLSLIPPYDSVNLTDGAVTTNRLTGGTGTFVAGKVSEDGLVDDAGWTGNNYTELLYSITLKQANFVNGDTLRFRVLRNDATTGLTYTQVPTISIAQTAGPPQTVTVTDIASGEAVGTTSVGQTIPATGIASGVVIGTPLVNQTVPVTGIVSGAAVGTASVNQTVSVAGIVSGEVIGTSGISQTGPPQTVTATGIASGEAIGTASVSQIFSVAGIASGEAVGTSGISQIGPPQTVAATGIASGEAVGTTSISQIGPPQTVTATGVASGEAVGTPSVSQTVPATGIASGEVLGTSSISQIGPPQTVTVTDIVSGEAVGTPDVSQGAPPLQIVIIIDIASGEAVGIPDVSQTEPAGPPRNVYMTYSPAIMRSFTR